MRLVHIENVSRKFKNYPRKALEEHKRIMLSTCTETILHIVYSQTFQNFTFDCLRLCTIYMYLILDRSETETYHAIVEITLLKMK